MKSLFKLLLMLIMLAMHNICIIAQGTWTQIGNMPEVRLGHTTDEINGKIYVAGGVKNEQTPPTYPTDTTMFICDSINGSWIQVSLPNSIYRSLHTSCVVDGNLYLIGGLIPIGGIMNSTAEMWMYNTTTGEWIPKPSMTTHRCNIDCAVVDGKIYVMGGMQVNNGIPNNTELLILEVYDIADGTWSPGPNMTSGRWGHQAIAYNGKIYVFGGNLPVYYSSVEVFDPQTNSWTILPTLMPTGRYQFTACLLDTLIYTIDGWFNSANGPIYDKVEVYDPIQNVWTTETPMPIAVGIPDCLTMNGKIYVFGGSNTTHPLHGTSDIYEFTPPSNIFQDKFDSYIVSQQLACQNPIEWTTWSNLPCDPTEDPYISSTYAYSGSNSVVIVQNNDLVRLHGSKTTGLWYSSFIFFIPTGKAGYFNTLSGFTPNPFQRAMECYFDAGGGGRLLNGTTVNFTWLENTWQQAMLVVNLDTHIAEFYLGTTSPLTQIATWDWTRGGTITNRIDASDFFGTTVNDQMFMDDYYFGDVMPLIIPVELTSFTATVKEGAVELNWSTATETNNSGFSIERKSSVSEYSEIGFVPGFGTTTETKSYSYTDSKVSAGKYTYRLKQIDFDGSFEYSKEVEVEISAPLEFSLEQNFPNPFNPTTTIQYSVSNKQYVTLVVYDVLGNEVETLVNDEKPAGTYEVKWYAANLPSGVYFYQLKAGEFIQTKKMILMK